MNEINDLGYDVRLRYKQPSQSLGIWADFYTCFSKKYFSKLIKLRIILRRKLRNRNIFIISSTLKLILHVMYVSALFGFMEKTKTLSHLLT